MDELPFGPENQPWYQDGLRFECTMCGNCCTGPKGYVWIAEEEGPAIAEALGLTNEQFCREYTRKVGKRRTLTERKTAHGYDCIFLDRESVPGKAVCGIYHARPSQCRTWPFWPENLRSRRTWASVKRQTPCPGMDRGNLVPLDRIRIQRDTTPA